MNDTNHVTVSGRLSREPELRYTPQGHAVAEFSVATTEGYETKQGEKRETTSFIDCKTWRGNAEKVGKSKKGDSIIVFGKLRVDSWEDKDTGKKRYKTYVLAEALTNPFGGAVKDAVTAPPRPAPIQRPAAIEVQPLEEQLGTDFDDVPF